MLVYSLEGQSDQQSTTKCVHPHSCLLQLILETKTNLFLLKLSRDKISVNT